MAKYLFLISHPAHFHMFKWVMKNLQNKGHEVVTVIRPKDIVEQLCKEAGIPFYKVGCRPSSGGKLGLAKTLFKRVKETDRVVKDVKPDLLLGSDGVLAYVGKYRHIPSFEFFDDDYPVIKLYANIYFPFYSGLICPKVTDAARWTRKKIGYDGYQKLAYLHPNVFTPDKRVVEKYFSADEPYFILRLVNLTAHHDGGIRGISTDVARSIINLLKPYGKVYVTSEKPLGEEFEQYRLQINPLDIHHIMYYAKIYVGDSQSMAVEAALLGTPSLRFNDFAGRISVLEELEHKYGLTFGIPSNRPDILYAKIKELLTMPNLNEEFQSRRKKMLSDKIDVSAFFTWFIENYPESKKIMKENPEYQYRFK